MPHFVATYAYTQDTAARDAIRAVHRDYLSSLDALLPSGPTDDGGAVLVFEADSAAQVESALDGDPFARHGGIIAARTVVRWDVVRGRWADRT